MVLLKITVYKFNLQVTLFCVVKRIEFVYTFCIGSRNLEPADQDSLVR